MKLTERSQKNGTAEFSKFLLHLSILSIVLILIYGAILSLIREIQRPSQDILIFVVLFLVTAGVHYFLLRNRNTEATTFASFIILSSVIKLFLFAIFTIVLVLADRSGALANVILFFSCYMILTVFEISSIFRKLST